MKKIFLLLIMIFSLVTITSCSNYYECSEDDFKCTISVDKTTVKVNDTVKVKVSVENISGKNIKIKMRHHVYKSLKDMLDVRLYYEGENHDFLNAYPGGYLRKLTFRKGKIVTVERTFKIEDIKNCEVEANIIFYSGKNYSKTIGIRSETIKITVEE